MQYPQIKSTVLALCLYLLGACSGALGGQPVGQPPKAADDIDVSGPQVKGGIDDILTAAAQGKTGILGDYRQLRQGSDGRQATLVPEEKEAALPARARDMLNGLREADAIVTEAEQTARTVLGSTDGEDGKFHLLILKALSSEKLGDNLTIEAIESITRAWREAESLVAERDNLFESYQAELRRGKVNDGTRLAWILIRVGAADPETVVIPGSFRFDADSAEIALRHHGSDITVRLKSDDYRQRVRATADGYHFRTGWAVLFQKPLGWMAETARAMRRAGVSPDSAREWEIMEGPEGLIALAASEAAPERAIPEKAFFLGSVREVEAIPLPLDAGRLRDEFVAAARALHEGIMADASIPLALRKALHPVLEGTYKEIDSRDYFDNDFCRRLIEADYLEAHINPLPAERADELAAYREALDRVEAGIDRFAVDLGADGRLIAVIRPDVDVPEGDVPDIRDSETGETVSRYQWRWERGGSTIFHSPLPSRYLYAMSVLERYEGSHRQRPVGVPASTEVWHALLGRVASYETGAAAAVGDPDLWQKAVVADARGRRESNTGPLGWDFPLFVPVRDDQGDPVLIATVQGVVPGPDFSGIADADERRRAQDAWMDLAAEVLPTPGELNLIYLQFFRYCSDSPLPELPNLIGSHYGLSDTHQTVYQSLERRWVGRLIGDCDDLGEFFQELTLRQGKLSYVMQLPAHAAAGYLEEAPEGGYQFIVLQTGPVLRFTDATREGVVEKAYRYFEDEVGGTQFTVTAVPLLLRFGGEDTRTPFVLSARVYWDRDYAASMIQVQEYWHLHTYSAGVRTMEDMIAVDREVGSIKELASLYERIGDYDRSLALRGEELAALAADPLGRLSVLLDMANLHVNGKDKLKALDALAGMEAILKVLREDQSDVYARTLSFRSAWAGLLSRLGEPEMAWELVSHDVEEALRRDGRFSDTLMRTLVTMYDRMAIQRDSEPDTALPSEALRVRYQVRAALEKAFGEGYFQAKDPYNKIHSRYFWLGRYGVAVAGRKAGLESLWRDGPYPEAPREHDKRDADLSELDWEWFRIQPRLYLAYGAEMLDREDHPELYDPVAARRTLELVRRAMDKGEEFGSGVLGRDALVKSELILSFINRDIDMFNRVMTMVRGKDYSSLYDDAALVFGNYCGLIPLHDFDRWIEAFHRFFPGRQQYFKAAYRAMDKEHFDHAVKLARATAGFFPKDALLTGEVPALERAVDRLREIKLRRGWDERDWAAARRQEEPDELSAWQRDIIEVVGVPPL